MGSKAVTNAELAILQLLWDQGPMTVRQLTEHLYPKQLSSDLATVQKLIRRLEEKEIIQRDRSSFVHTIHPVLDRDQFAAHQLSETARKLTRGSLKPLLIHLLENDQLTSEELAEIKRLIDKQRRKRKPKK